MATHAWRFVDAPEQGGDGVHDDRIPETRFSRVDLCGVYSYIRLYYNI